MAGPNKICVKVKPYSEVLENLVIGRQKFTWLSSRGALDTIWTLYKFLLANDNFGRVKLIIVNCSFQFASLIHRLELKS